ncbi:MAG: PA2169 family four-helix-bundle protein [Acidobacteriota bacterium]|nr:PA2169 family four-helix-bundle protein [Acidobacteriota bacterium]
MASNNNDNVISTLNNLIQTCKDATDGFREAAQGINSDDLRDLFTRYSQQRAQFTTELQDEVRKLGGEPETSGSLAASLHRGWINIREALQGNDEAAVLNECERGEDVAVDAYQDALKQALPSDIMSIVERQYMQIREAHDRIKSLRNISTAAAS